ncbi:MAG: hypothetical protein CMJ58_03745 [Planctomycetaceae bacterium]|nr:hypothetical protein [Planctomycetaceae bacterium]
MTTVILDPREAQQLIDERRARGLDAHDEVWEGTYMMAPVANNEHQDLLLGLALALRETVVAGKLGKVYPGVNVARNADDWKHDFRVPDLAVYLNGNPATDCDTFYHGGPDLAVEIVSRHDRTRDKVSFYAEVGTRELLIVDREPWRLELLKFANGKTTGSAVATVGDTAIASVALPLTFGLEAGSDRPVVVVTHSDGRAWRV